MENGSLKVFSDCGSTNFSAVSTAVLNVLASLDVDGDVAAWASLDDETYCLNIRNPFLGFKFLLTMILMSNLFHRVTFTGEVSILEAFNCNFSLTTRSSIFAAGE
jgi:hypothetical protein